MTSDLATELRPVEDSSGVLNLSAGFTHVWLGEGVTVEAAADGFRLHHPTGPAMLVDERGGMQLASGRFLMWADAARALVNVPPRQAIPTDGIVVVCGEPATA